MSDQITFTIIIKKKIIESNNLINNVLENVMKSIL